MEVVGWLMLFCAACGAVRWLWVLFRGEDEHVDRGKELSDAFDEGCLCGCFILVGLGLLAGAVALVAAFW